MRSRWTDDATRMVRSTIAERQWRIGSADSRAPRMIHTEDKAQRDFLSVHPRTPLPANAHATAHKAKL